MAGILKYVKGATPGKAAPQPKEKSAQQKQLQSKVYEAKRERSFNKKWCTGRLWLQYDETNNTMVCSYCTEFYRGLGSSENNPWCSEKGVGGTSLKLDNVKTHEGTKFHIKAAKAILAGENPGSTPAAVMMRSLTKIDYVNLDRKFRNAHFVAKQGLSYRVYPMLCELDVAKGLDIGPTYRTDKMGRTFIGVIAGTGSQCNVKMSSYQFRRSRCGDKTILCLEPSYLLSWISCTGIGKIAYLYWIRAQMYEMNNKIMKEDNYILKYY